MTWIYIGLSFMLAGLLGIFWTLLFAAQRSDDTMDLIKDMEHTWGFDPAEKGKDRTGYFTKKGSNV